jgi:Fe-S-cluster containining protein
MSPADLNSALCMACGMCCTGAIHGSAELDADEIEGARSCGLTLTGSTSKPQFTMPCTALRGSVCTIYEHRPRTCRGYRCQLLERLDRHEIGFEEALEKVSEARRLVAAVEAVLPTGKTLPDSRKPLTGQPADPLLHLRGAALALYVDRHFRSSREGAWLVKESLSTSTEEDKQ